MVYVFALTIIVNRDRVPAALNALACSPSADTAVVPLRYPVAKLMNRAVVVLAEIE